MSNTKLIFVDKGSDLDLTINGAIDEDIMLESVAITSGKTIHVHLDGVTMINSTGIRQWISWLKKYQNESWVFWGCPPIFVNQLNMIEGFIPLKSRVQSFYIPYYSNETDEEKRLLMLRSDWEKDPKNFPSQKDSNGNEMTLDVLPDKYFKFLSRY